MHWYDWHTVTERLQGRSYALTRGRPYRVILDPATQTGTCDFTNKQILINPNLFSDVFEKMGLSGTKLDEANFLVSRAITGHEALHVLYSDPAVVMSASEDANLKMVLNLLEDARIEKIGAGMSHVSKTLFGFVNGIAASQLPKFADLTLEDAYSVLSLLLRWRLGASIPPLECQAVTKWRKILRIAQQALYAADCDEVLHLARKIVKIAGLDKAKQQDSSALKETEDVMNRMQSGMSGSDGHRPLPNPLKSNDEPRTDQSESELGDNAGDPADAEGNDCTRSAEHDPAEDNSGQSGQADQEMPDDEADDSDAAPQVGGEYESDEEIVHSLHSPLSPADVEKLVDETAMQVSEDLNTLVPDSSDDSLIVARAKMYRGRRYSDIIASPYMHYLPVAAPIAAEIIRDLKVENPRAVSGPSQYPGRFKARYFVRDCAKPFAAQHFRGIATPKMALTLIIDRSGSMEDVQEELRVMAIAITMACETLQIPLSIWALEGQVQIKSFDEHGPQVLAKLAGIRAETLTRVMPTVRDAAKELSARPESLKQIVMIHDGMPSDRMDFIEWRVTLRDIGMFCMFIMQHSEYEQYRQAPQQLRENMDSLVGPRCFAISLVTGIAKHWCSFVRNTRTRHSVVV